MSGKPLSWVSGTFSALRAGYHLGLDINLGAWGIMSRISLGAGYHFRGMGNKSWTSLDIILGREGGVKNRAGHRWTSLYLGESTVKTSTTDRAGK